MPRETINIDYFRSGLFNSKDAKDVPPDAFVDEIDVDNEAPDGVIRGRLKDVTGGVYDSAGNPRSYAFLRNPDADLPMLVMHNNFTTPEEIAYVTSFSNGGGGSKTVLGKIPDTSGSVAIRHNQEVYFGFGPSENNRPKWVGYLTQQWWGGSSDSGVQLADSELTLPTALPFFHKIVVDETAGVPTTVYGFEHGGNTLYKITVSGGAVATSNADTFTSIYAICNEDATYLWVLDMGVGTYGTLNKVTKATLAINTTIILGSFALNQPAYISDMVATANKVWFGAFCESEVNAREGKSTAIALESKVVWMIAKNATNGTSPSDRSPRLGQAGGTTAGEWVLKSASGTLSAIAAKVSEGAKHNLVVLDSTNDKVGYYLRMYDYRQSRGYTEPQIQYKNSGGTSTIIMHAIFVIASTIATNGVVPVIHIDDNTMRNHYDGFLWDATGGAGSMILYGTLWKGLYKKTGLSIPANPGDVQTALLPGGSTFVMTYYSALCQLTTFLYSTRISTNTVAVGDVIRSGADDIDTGLTTMTQIVDGGAVSVTPADTPATTNWKISRKHFYKIALVYDDYQVSPLSYVMATISNSSANTTNKTVTVAISNTQGLSKRVSGFILFRADGDPDSPFPEGFYRQVEQINFHDSRWTFSGTTATVIIYDSTEDGGMPYEQLTGMPETLQTSMVHYGLAAVLNNQMFVGNCWKSGLPDATQFIFRSQPGRFSMFNWVEDYLKLPFRPTAMAAWSGRIFVFDETRCARINPEGMFIEDITVGVGASNDRMVCVTDYGMFCANKNNVYMHDGKSFSPIGTPILYTSDDKVFVDGYIPTASTYPNGVMGYFPLKHSVMILFPRADQYVYAYVFNLLYQRWDYWMFPSSIPFPYEAASASAIITDEAGQSYLCTYGKAQGLCQDSSVRKVWGVRFKVQDLDDGAQSKKFYKIKSILRNTDATNYISLTAVTDGGTDTSNTGTIVLTAAYRKTKVILLTALSFTDNAKNPQLENIQFIGRHLIGKR